MKKRILSMILCIAMFLTVLPAAVFASDSKIDIVTVNVPYDLTDGAAMPFDSSLLTVGDPALYRAYLWGDSWTGPEGMYMPDEYNMPHFTGGERYTLMVLIVPEDGATGLDSSTAPFLPVYINGERARFNPACSPLIEEAPDKTVYAYEIDLQCPYTNEIDIVEIFGFTPPTPGAVPCDINDLSVPENAPYYIRSVIWERYNGDPSANDETEMAAGETFTDGVYYYLNVTLCPYDGYTFSTGDVTWRINGTPYNGYIDEVYCYISSPTAAKLFSADLKAESRHIDYIDIEGLGGFYEGAAAKTAFENVTAPDAEGYTLYFDEDTVISAVSNNTYIKATAVFQSGESYRATFCARPDPGWTIDNETVWRINGSEENVYYAAQSGDHWYVKSIPIAPAAKTPIKEVYIYGYEMPEVGQTAGDALTMYVAGDLYEIVDAYWFCDTDSIHMAETDTFEEGKLYSACVVVRLRDPSFTIDDTTVFYLNGGEFAVEQFGARTNGDYYVWTEQMEAITPTLTHIVSWYLDPNDDFAVAGIEIEDGGLYGGPAEPNRDGYTFGGWFTDRACTVPYDPNAPIHEDIELFPLWIPAVDPDKIAITAINAWVPVPVIGQTPAGMEAVTFTATPEGAPLFTSALTWFYWLDTIPDANKWCKIEDPDYIFEAGETYAVDIFACVEEGSDYVFDPAVVGTVNGQPSDDSYDDLWQSESTVYLSYVWTAQEEPPVPVDPCEGYTDINRSSWYHTAADFVLERGIMSSTKTDRLTFEPTTACTRAMIAQMLYSLEGKPEVTFEKSFPDVKETDWFASAVTWAYQNGVVGGYDNGKFGPNDKVTREQMAVILKAYTEKVKKMDTSKVADLSGFADANKATWSKPFIRWAVAEGLISGKAQNGKTYLDPQGNATRAEVAAIMMSFITKVVGG